MALICKSVLMIDIYRQYNSLSLAVKRLIENSRTFMPIIDVGYKNETCILLLQYQNSSKILYKMVIFISNSEFSSGNKK